MSRYADEFGSDGAYRLLWQGFGVISGGRAGYALGHLVPKHPAEAFAHEACAGTLLYARHSHFDLYGNYVPGFCGGLAVGDWRELPQLLDDFQVERYPSLIGILVGRGPYGVMEMAQAKYGYEPLDGYTGKCHLCVDVRRHLVKAGDDFAEIRPRGFYEHI